MKHYVYTDLSKGEIVARGYAGNRVKRTGEVIFECDAANLLAADALLTSATGIDPSKTAEVICTLNAIPKGPR